MVRIIGTIQQDKDVLLYYSYLKGIHNFFKMTKSENAMKFGDNSKYVIVTDPKQREEKTYDWKDFRVSKQGDSYFLTYRVNSKSYSNVNGAVSKDLLRWTKTGKIENIKETAAVVPDYKLNNRYIMYYGEKSVKLAFSGDLKTWKTFDKPVLEPREGHYDDGDIEVGSVFRHEKDILLTYIVKKKQGKGHRVMVGAALFDHKNPDKLIWRTEAPIWEHPQEFHHEQLKYLGAALLHEELVLYWLIGENHVYAVACPFFAKHVGLKDKVIHPILNKHPQNPILAPRPSHPWDSRAAFNSAAVYEDGKVHFLYRALGDTDLSVLGYATSKDGFTIDERSEEPIYLPREPWETPGNRMLKTFADHYVSGGGYGGVEDPRLTKVEDRFYLTYVAYDGANPPRVAMSSISEADFRSKNWKNWAKPKLISAPGMVNKSAVIFPEKINGKYVVFHRVYPNILVDLLDDLNFEQYLQGHYFISPRKTHWDSKKVGAGAPPMRTKDGWLMIYQSVGYQDPSRYKIGAMMLDGNDPTKVLYRANKPILEPVEHYENNGFKRGVVYPCGAVIVDGQLMVYYGGADSYVCAASADLDTFLNQMKYNQEPKLHKVQSSFLG